MAAGVIASDTPLSGATLIAMLVEPVSSLKCAELSMSIARAIVAKRSFNVGFMAITGDDTGDPLAFTRGPPGSMRCYS